MPRAKPTTTLTPMPSTNIELGKYVTLRARADGTHRVFFQVPARLRPSAWPSLIPLPQAGERTGDLRDAGQVAAIQRDAKALYDDLTAARDGLAKPARRTFDTLVRLYQESDAWTTLRPKTQKVYGTYLNHIKAWAAYRHEPDPSKTARGDVDTLLASFKDAPVTKKHVRKSLRLLMETTRSLGWRTDNPCDGIRLRTPKSRVDVWEQEDVDAYVAAAEDIGFKSIAGIILLEWEIGQRLTDVRGFRPGMEYDAGQGVFRFHQSKTDSYVTIPVSEALRARMEACAGNELFLFRDEITGSAYTEERLSKVFAQVRAVAVKAGARRLLLRWLRHSCVVQLNRAGCDVPQVASITGHSPAGAAKILATYMPRDNAVAWEAQAKRGLVERKVAG